MTIHIVNQRLDKIYTMMYTTCVSLTTASFLFRRHVNDDSQYYKYTVFDKRKLNIKKIRPLLFNMY